MKTLNMKVWKRRSLLEMIIFMFHVKKWGSRPQSFICFPLWNKVKASVNLKFCRTTAKKKGYL